MTKSFDYDEFVARNSGYIVPATQARIRQTRLLIAGCGIGSSPAVCAARMGFENFVLVDGDVVDAHNLNRQFYDFADVGRPKVDALAEKILRINPEARIETVKAYLGEDNTDEIVDRSDIVFDTVDFLDLPAILRLHTSAKRRRVPVFTALSVGFGALVWYFPADTPLSLADIIAPDVASVSRTNDAAPAYAEVFAAFVQRIAPYLDRQVVEQVGRVLALMKDGKPCPAPQVAVGRTGAVRLKMPREGRCVFDDRVRGRVEVQWSEEQDHVIQRADGSVLYNLASVVDDEDMQITHVIRSSEHLSNTPRQIFIARSLGYRLPEYAHVPFVAEPGSKNKLSKRKIREYLKNQEFKKLYEHGEGIAKAMGLEIAAETFNPVLVDFYAQTGYLPAAILNYLVLVGWSLDDKTETFSLSEMAKLFTLERINKAPASFDPRKLLAFQERYMNLEPLETKVAMAVPYLQRAGLLPADLTDELLDRTRRVVAAAGDRIKVGGDVLGYAEFFIPDGQLSYDEAVFDKRLRTPPEAAGLVRKFRDQIQGIEPFDAATIEARLQSFVETEGIGHGQIVHSLRVALTGKGVGFGLFDSFAILGKSASIARIDRALGRL